MPDAPVLVVLAAGLGSRFGGTKQLTGVGPSGEIILDYNVHDAVRAGFGAVVLVVRTDLAEPVQAHVGAGFGRLVPTTYAFQDRLGPPREKPWGTAHAVLSAREQIGDRPFAVVNADDLYGPESLAVSAEFLRERAGPDRHALVGFRLGATVSPTGPVSRGVCETDAGGNLIRVVERTHLSLDPGTGAISDEAGGRYDPASPVSMNLWCFHPAILGLIEEVWVPFRDAHGDDRAELFLPLVATELLTRGGTVEVLATADRWLGVTYAEELDGVRAEVAGLVAAGRYPSPLWAGS